MKLQIIVGSVRRGRTSIRLAKWVQKVANAQLPDAEVEIVDLVDYQMPFFDEEISPQYNPERKPEGVVKQFLNKVSEADGYIILTPEYNRSYSAVLKNALDYLDFQFAKKPVAIVAHGSAGGAQAVGHLRGTLAGVLAVSVPQATMITGRVGVMFSEDGTPTADVSNSEHALHTTLDNLRFYTNALSTARA